MSSVNFHLLPWFNVIANIYFFSSSGKKGYGTLWITPNLIIKFNYFTQTLKIATLKGTHRIMSYNIYHNWLALTPHR